MQRVEVDQHFRNLSMISVRRSIDQNLDGLKFPTVVEFVGKFVRIFIDIKSGHGECKGRKKIRLETKVERQVIENSLLED